MSAIGDTSTHKLLSERRVWAKKLLADIFYLRNDVILIALCIFSLLPCSLNYKNIMKNYFHNFNSNQGKLMFSHGI